MSTRQDPMAWLKIEVDFDDVPDQQELESVVETLRGFGRVRFAELVFLKEAKKDLSR